MKILMKDGIKYLLYQYKDESELEEYVKKHIKFIFGDGSLFFEKTKIKSRAGIGSIPDGFVLQIHNQKWYVLEIELAQHPLYEHIVPQISKFYSGIKNHTTRKKLIDAFYEEIKSNPLLMYVYEAANIKKDLYKFLTDLVNDSPEIVVIIDNKTKEIEDICASLPFPSRVIEFKTYQREQSNVFIYAFEVLAIFRKEEKMLPIDAQIGLKETQIVLRGQETITQILEVAKLVLKHGKSYKDAVKEVANRKNVCESTVRDKCTRRMGLNTSQFLELLQNKDKLINFLIKKFPNNRQMIIDTLGE